MKENDIKKKGKEKMKKNIAMRVAAFLFILTMISTCAFATTFAKYTTSGDTTDTARVAKWGVTVTAVAEENQKLFTNEYLNASEATVKATVDVVAPGTSGELSKFTISGTPEVKAQVTYAATLTLEGWVVEGSDYCPIVIKVGSTTCTGSTMEELKNKVATAVAAQGATYSVGEPIEDTLVITWEWAYSGDDAKDTALGDLATAPTIKLDITATVTQLD